MNRQHKKIWELAIPYLKKGLNKDFVLHTEGAVKATELILKKEKVDPEILIPSAILHDVGWANVPKKYQQTSNKEYKLKGLESHLKEAPSIVKSILSKLSFKESAIKEIIDIIKSHQLHKPKKLQKRILVDADQLSDIFKENFSSDLKSYKQTPNGLLSFRIKDNKFYTKIAQDIFTKEVWQRQKEYKIIEKTIKKYLRFSEPLPQMILNGEKTTSWRINDEKNISVGDIVPFLRKNGEEFAKAKIINVKETTFGNLNAKDWEGHEKFNSDEEMYHNYSKDYNIKITSKTALKIIKFKLI